MSLDFSSGYWHIPISKETRGVTTFITERGKYIWNVLPQGLRCSSDHFLRITDEALWHGGLVRYIKNFANMLLYAKILKELVENFHNLLEICCNNWITLQPKKLGLLTPDSGPVNYAGLSMSHLGFLHIRRS